MFLTFYLLVLLVSFYFLAVICDRYFIDSLDRIANKLKMDSDMAGATFMAVGSSAPELFVAFIALFKPGNEAIGAGTIVGSALFNVLVIIGAAAMVKVAVISWQPVIRDVIFYSVSIILLLISFKDGSVDLFEALIFIALYVIYIFAVLKWRKVLPYKDKNRDDKVASKEARPLPARRNFLTKLKKAIYRILDFIFPKAKKYWLVFIFSILTIAGLSYILVESAVAVAEILNIPSVIIGLTILAIGTSVPDLVSSIIVARQGRGGMAISNAIGSNIFDILIGLGLPWVLVISIYGGKIPVVTKNLNSSIFLLFATVIAILFLLILRRWKIGRFSGLFLISLYLAYLVWAVMQAL
jgi:K+-dependent Na+/Ca+ exchanger-like protein